ncbi:MAG: hypothetical protein PHY45_03980 [Rhodocyclaceae bacterium]|nr:hypothetical protein [Rhodocyclaceae bacterium]
MIKPELQAIYEVEFCSGEHRRWRYLGPDSRSLNWWQDVETGREFSEASVMYAWQIVPAEDDSQAAP